MKINRHNYEEFFLLYADNELTANQRLEVEYFVQQNPDLKEELNLLLELRLEPDSSLFFDNKESLLQPISLEGSADSITEEQDKILRFIDLELNAQETNELKREIDKNPSLKTELEIFSKTKLQPDLSVVFPDKSLLYKTKGEKVRVFQMTWVRVAAAAAIIVVAGLLWINNSVEEIAGTGPLASITETSTDKLSLEGSENKEESNNEVETENSQANDLKDEKLQIASASIPNAARLNNNAQADKSLEKQTVLKVDNQREQNHIIYPNNKPENLTTPGNEQTLVNVSPNLTRKDDITDHATADADVKSDYATEALMSAQDAVEVVTVEDNTTRKGPIRGIVRKANRLFNKVTNPDMDKPLVKVANFEIALAK